MAINPTLPPTVAEFRAAFPEFSGASDDRVQLYLDIGMTWVDTYWFSPDAKIAAMYTAAHYLYLHDQAAGGAITGEDDSGIGGGGGTVDPEIGKIWVKTVRFRDRMVSYERVNAAKESAKTTGGSSAASAEFWESSPYGLILLSYRRRNVPHIAVV